MVEQGRLSSRGGHDGDLKTVRIRLDLSGRADKPTVSLSSKRIFILAADVPVAALSPAVTILVM